MFSPLGNIKASDETSKSSLRDMFEADVECYEKAITISFPIIKKRLALKALGVDVDAILPKETVHFKS